MTDYTPSPEDLARLKMTAEQEMVWERLVAQARQELEAAQQRVSRLENLLNRILGDDGPDLDAYLDGHVTAPSVKGLLELAMQNAQVADAYRVTVDRLKKENNGLALMLSRLQGELQESQRAQALLQTSALRERDRASELYLALMKAKAQP